MRAGGRRRAAAVARLCAAVAGVLALVLHLDYSLGSGGSAFANFFSYFTMQSAFIGVFVWTAGGVISLRRPTDPRWLVAWRLLATTYQVVSGIVYTIIVLEATGRGLSIQVPPSSQVLHYWMPAYALLDWLFFPGRGRVSWRILRVALVFPLLWGGFTMIRGAAVGWYPYFFLDPYQVSGPVEFTIYSVIVLSFILVMTVALTAASRRLPRPSWEGGDDGPHAAIWSAEDVASITPTSGGEERLETRSSPHDDLVVGELGEGERTLTADHPHEHR
ncbi:Pr6Pr family membrane protein [Marisediminicola sp. LYQ134]|uniref:Pr6Pr family membrane protein n=1 Tax=unclassified Marisediminicola TaxID=2618316 RepID=UPI0039834F5E